MRIAVGSRNNIKVNAVKEFLKRSYTFATAKVVSIEIPSGVSEQPMSLREAIRGARNRARGTFEKGKCTFGVGIESGLMSVPYSKSRKMNICVCVFYDGERFHMGLSSAFEFPASVMQLVYQEGLSVSEASQKAGLTPDPNIAHKEGAVGLLTKGRLTRKSFIKQAVMMALIHLEHPELYA